MSVVWQQKTHGVLRRQRQIYRTLARLFIAVVSIATLLGAAYLTLVAANVRLAREVWALEHALVDVQRENQQLLTEIARASAIPNLQERSVSLGYHPAGYIDYLYMGGP